MPCLGRKAMNSSQKKLLGPRVYKIRRKSDGFFLQKGRCDPIGNAFQSKASARTSWSMVERRMHPLPVRDQFELVEFDLMEKSTQPL